MIGHVYSKSTAPVGIPGSITDSSVLFIRHIAGNRRLFQMHPLQKRCAVLTRRQYLKKLLSLCAVFVYVYRYCYCVHHLLLYDVFENPISVKIIIIIIIKRINVSHKHAMTWMAIIRQNTPWRVHRARGKRRFSLILPIDGNCVRVRIIALNKSVTIVILYRTYFYVFIQTVAAFIASSVRVYRHLRGPYHLCTAARWHNDVVSRGRPHTNAAR